MRFELKKNGWPTAEAVSVLVSQYSAQRVGSPVGMSLVIIPEALEWPLAVQSAAQSRCRACYYAIVAQVLFFMLGFIQPCECAQPAS